MSKENRKGNKILVQFKNTKRMCDSENEATAAKASSIYSELHQLGMDMDFSNSKNA
jgi:hypothetical protein